MTGLELVYAGIAFVAVGLFLFGIRRAARKSLKGGAAGQIGAGSAARPSESKKTSGRKRSTPKDDERVAKESSKSKSPSKTDDDTESTEDIGPEAEELPDDEPAESPAGDGAGDDDSEALRAGLAKTRGGFVARLGKLFSKKQIDANILDEVEEVLFTADIGPKTAERLFSAVKGELSRSELEDPEAIWSKLREQATEILSVDTDAIDFAREKPFVLLTIGVNGVGKTTTIGKIAAKLTDEGKKVILAAGDTFRAAAVEQLEVWGERSGCEVIKGKSGGDPSSVIFDAIKRGQDEGADVVIADTAGRLHTKVDLMEELKKVGRVVDKAMPGAPHETFLVLDATTGQNAIQQAEIFKQAMNITGIVLTKLDGTAKGGVILGIADELEVPVRYIGIGEQVADLREFDADSFVRALFSDDGESEAA